MGGSTGQDDKTEKENREPQRGSTRPQWLVILEEIRSKRV